MSSLYKLITKTNLKSPVLAFPLVMPLIFILLYSVGIKGLHSQAEIDALVATFFTTILAIVTMQNGLMGFGINFIAIKKSVLLKRIGATELSKLDVIVAVLFYGLTLWVISFVWIFLVMIIFSAIGIFYSPAQTFLGIETFPQFTATAFGWIQYVNWPRMAIATIVMIIPSYGLGLFFTSVAKEDQMYMGMAMIYFFFAGFVGGIMFPGDTPHWMQLAGYLIPHAYVGNIYDWASGASPTIWGLSTTSTIIVSSIIPIIFGILITAAAAKLLKFD